MITNLQSFIHPISLDFSLPHKKGAVAADELCRRERHRAVQTRGAATRLSVVQEAPGIAVLWQREELAA